MADDWLIAQKYSNAFTIRYLLNRQTNINHHRAQESEEQAEGMRWWVHENKQRYVDKERDSQTKQWGSRTVYRRQTEANTISCCAGEYKERAEGKRWLDEKGTMMYR